MGIPDHLTCLLGNLYAGQEATVRTGHGTTDWFQIGKGVHQGCMLSPCLFNLYAEYIMRNAGLEEAQAGIKTAGRNINHLRYADDTTLMAESEEELKSLLMKVKLESEKVGLKLNIQKTKIMASGPITSCEIDGETVEAVSDFIFGGSKITVDGDCSHEIKRRLLLGRKVMTNLLLLLSCFSRVRLCGTPEMTAHQAPLSLGSPGKNTGVCCHFLLQCMKVRSESEVAQSCPTLRDPMNCSLPGSSAHGILQARILEWVAIAFSMTNLDSILKCRDITLPTKVRLVKAMVFPVVMCGCESWTVKKAEC
uniref:RNA-directed DNA polymerase n=1 Tax=Bos indicus x Bos taurus TaxID=30522 RepID=A0A4W2IQ90_BOBOX